MKIAKFREPVFEDETKERLEEMENLTKTLSDLLDETIALLAYLETICDNNDYTVHNDKRAKRRVS